MKLRFRTRPKEDAMKHQLRARVSAGCLFPLEPLELPEGTEVDVQFDVLEPSEVRRVVTFGEWDLGVIQPLTRASIYEDVG